MNDGVAMPPGAWGQVRVQEPAGERVLGETLSIGGSGSDIVVPGVESGAALSIVRRAGLWVAEGAPGAVVRFNGRPLTAARDLRRDDVLSVGDAQVTVSGASRTLLRLSVTHLAGNVTIAPAASLATVASGQGGDRELEIQVPGAGGGRRARAALRCGPEARRVARRRRGARRGSRAHRRAARLGGAGGPSARCAHPHPGRLVAATRRTAVDAAR
jgi:hypothetical protein